MLFEEVLPLVREGVWARRRAWSGTHKAIHIQMPDERSKMTLPYLYYRDEVGECVPWVAKQRDLLEADWYVLD